MSSPSYIRKKDCFKLGSSHSIDSRNGYSRPKAAIPAPELFHLRLEGCRWRMLPLLSIYYYGHNYCCNDQQCCGSKERRRITSG